MQHSPHSPLSPSGPALFDPLQSPSSRQKSSIWAPRPLVSDTTWPRHVDTFGRRFREFDSPQQRSDPYRSHYRSGNALEEDVFGPVGFAATPRKYNVGAIGDGRKRSSPDLDDSVCLFFPYTSHSL